MADEADLVQAVARSLGVEAAAAARACDAVLDAARELLLRRGTVELPKLMRVSMREEQARFEKDPKTGRQRVMPARTVLEVEPLGAVQRAVGERKLSSIVVAVPRDKSFAKIVGYHFEQAGYRIEVVHDVESTVRAARAPGANLVLLDHALEHAHAAIEELKLHRQTAHVPVVSLFEEGDGPEVRQGLVVLPDDHLVKPFELYALLLLAESALARAAARTDSAQHRVKLKLTGQESDLERAAAIIDRLLTQAAIPEEDRFALGYAVREALANAVQHGHGGDKTRTLRLEYALERERVRISIEDTGPGFDHKTALAKALSEGAASLARERSSEGKSGGLGVALMARCADELAYGDPGNRLTLVKRLAGTAGAKPA